MLIYLDNCSYNRPFDDQSQVIIKSETQSKLYIQEQILNKKYDLCWSFVIEYENSNNPFSDKRKKIAKWRAVAKVIILKSTKEIRDKAKQLKELGLKEFDALHISCAISANCEYFITTDKRVLNKNITEIQIVDPIEFIRRCE